MKMRIDDIDDVKVDDVKVDLISKKRSRFPSNTLKAFLEQRQQSAANGQLFPCPPHMWFADS